MLLPLALALVTAMVLIVVIAPLMKGLREAPPRLEFDRAVYRDQLQELERDRARGLIGEREAETARLEIERRMLAADRADRPLVPEGGTRPVAAIVLSLAVAIGAGGLYAYLGSPGVPDDPFASRTNQAAGEESDLAKSARDLEAELAAKPDDADGWGALGRTDAELSEWQKSADAYTHAVALAPERVEFLAGLGEAETFAADGVVTPAAADAFRKVLAQDQQNGVARYYMALADAQAGRTQQAIDEWQKLAAQSPEGAPVRDQIKRRIDEAAQQAGMTPPPLAPPSPAAASAPPPASSGAPAAAAPPATEPGPTQAQIAAAANMTPAEQQQMIHGMVDQLAAELKAQPNNRDGWLRLARAYSVLGERDKSADAYDRASTLDPKDVSIKLGEVDALLDGNALDQPLSPRVLALLRQVETLSPQEPEALWYLGLAAAQAKKPDEAASYWNRLLATLPADAPERKTVTAAIAALKGK
jgi:cytochrome c-type biogenesis protein CcmH